jgi:hypothetical protein
VEPAWVNASCVASHEELLHFAEDIVEAARLVARRRAERIAVARITRPNHGVPGVPHGFQNWGQGRGDFASTHTNNQCETTWDSIWVERFTQRDYIAWNSGGTHLAPDRVVNAS